MSPKTSPIHVLKARLAGPSLMIALSGQTPKQLSHSKQLPHDRHRRASNCALDSSRPPTTSSKVVTRRATSSSGLTVAGASA